MTTSVFAIQKNPQIRICHRLGGEFIVAASHNDQIGFCQFDKAIVGAIDLFLFDSKERINQSINSYMKGQTECSGEIETLIVLDRESLRFCTYPDGSHIELGTLIKGSHSNDNVKLNQALGL